MTDEVNGEDCVKPIGRQGGTGVDSNPGCS